MIDAFSVLLIGLGAGFFFAGTVGLLRLPDLFTRLHAVTKADTLGLGFVAVGLALQAPNLLGAAKLVLVWLAAALWAATAGQLVAARGRAADRDHADLLP